MRVVDLTQLNGAPRRVRLAALTGCDELAVAGADAASAMALLARLGRDADGRPLEPERLGVSQADRLLAALYNELYGDTAECRMRCAACGEGYEFTLALSGLIAAQDAERPESPGPDGAWSLPDGRRLRAPLVGDLAAARSPEELASRLIVEGDPDGDPAAVAEFLERAAPVLSLDLGAACPHCGSAETVRFDLARYLAARIAGEQPFLVRETHLIASHYGWSHAEIMALTRTDRRAYARLIEAERAAGRGPRRTG
jgi:hypothetical protein